MPRNEHGYLDTTAPFRGNDAWERQPSQASAPVLELEPALEMESALALELALEPGLGLEELEWEELEWGLVDLFLLNIFEIYNTLTLIHFLQYLLV